SSNKLAVGDQFRLNLSSCVDAFSFVYAVESNVGGSFSAAANNATKSVLVTFNGPTTYFDPNMWVRVRIELFTGSVSPSCSNPSHPAPQTCGATFESLSSAGTFYPSLVAGSLVIGCASDLGTAGATGAT